MRLPRRRTVLALVTLASGVLVAACAGPGAARQEPGSAVVTVPLSWSNAYLVLGEGVVLVDPGSPGEGDVARIEAALAARGLGWGDLSLVVLTHGHADHAGAAAAVAEASGAPVLAGAADAAMLARGESGPLPAMGAEARMVRPFVPKRFPPLAPDTTVGAWPGGASLDLAPFGVAGIALHTPGHTPGSLVVLLGSGEAIVGDLFRGGILGGRVDAGTPHRHYFHADAERAEATVSGLLGRGATRFYLGHGGPVSAEDARERFAR